MQTSSDAEPIRPKRLTGSRHSWGLNRSVPSRISLCAPIGVRELSCRAQVVAPRFPLRCRHGADIASRDCPPSSLLIEKTGLPYLDAHRPCASLRVRLLREFTPLRWLRNFSVARIRGPESTLSGLSGIATNVLGSLKYALTTGSGSRLGGDLRCGPPKVFCAHCASCTSLWVLDEEST
jgi:hypothetical protein